MSADGKVRRKTSARSAAARSKILAAGRRLVARSGWDSLTISAISSEAGVYTYAIHYHFGSKAGLIAVMVDDILKDVFQGLQGVLEGISAGEERLHAMLEALHSSSDPGLDLLFFDTLSYAIRNEDLRMILVAQYGRHCDFILGLLDQPQLDTTEARRLAMLTLAVVDGLSIQRLLDPDGEHEEVQDVFEALLHLRLDP